MTDDDALSTKLNTDTNTNEVKVTNSIRIELFYQNRLYVVTRDELPFYLGRDNEACDLVITGDTISRKHCVLQWRDKQIGVLDTSTNGTFVRPGRAGNVFIHSEFYPLVGQGAMKLGQRLSEEDDSDVIFFKVISQ